MCFVRTVPRTALFGKRFMYHSIKVKKLCFCDPFLLLVVVSIVLLCNLSWVKGQVVCHRSFLWGSASLAIAVVALCYPFQGLPTSSSYYQFAPHFLKASLEGWVFNISAFSHFLRWEQHSSAIFSNLELTEMKLHYNKIVKTSTVWPKKCIYEASGTAITGI